MSGADTPGGPDWWLASDGKWYPPQTRGGGPLGGPGPLGGDLPEGSFFSRLFDLSMRTFITPSIVRVLFVLGVIVATLSSLFALVAFALAGDGGIIVGLIVAPLLWILMVIWFRVAIELIVVFFRIEENTRKK